MHVVIIGFSARDSDQKYIFEASTQTKYPAHNISPYLVEASDVCVTNRSTPFGDVPKMRFGSMPRDGGHLILSEVDRKLLLKEEPQARPFVRRYTGAQEFLNGGKRFCLWLEGASPATLHQMPNVLARLKAVAEYRRKSKAASTRTAAATPGKFVQLAQPLTKYLLVPRVSSERREYIPIAFMKADVVANDQVLTIEGATVFHLGLMSSKLHMVWVSRIAGRLKSDFRYSKDVVYNNYPWPPNPSAAQKAKVEELAQAVLDARDLYTDSTLAQLYDPISMPPELTKAHHALDRAVERCYRPEPFTSDRERVEYLFGLYEKLTAPLLPVAPKPRRARKSATNKTADSR